MEVPRGERRSFVKFHPTDVVLEEFYLSHGEKEQSLLAHLVRCPRCTLRLESLTGRSSRDACHASWEEANEDFASCFGEAPNPMEEVVSKERAAAPSLFVEMMSFSPERRSLLIRNSSRFQSWGLCELLLERCRETAIQNPAGAEELALIALEVSTRLSASSYRDGLVQDLQARAWSCLGNAHRVRSEFLKAEDSFLKAEAFLRQGSRDPVERAIFLDLKASLRRAQRRFDEALALLKRAVVIFRRAGHFHRAGRSLVKIDLIHCYAGNPELGIPILYQAIHLIDPDQEPHLQLCARHNLIHNLAERGRFLEARKLYRETRPLYRDFPDSWTQNRRKWVKGKIARGLGRSVQAERLFLAARDGFIENGASYDTALISLELAVLYSQENRTADLKRLAQEMLPIFSSLQIHREALAALSFLQQALDAERASLALVSRVADFLRRAEHDPGLRFEP
jgi:tetratricopeptide (TPR) repeat protein